MEAEVKLDGLCIYCNEPAYLFSEGGYGWFPDGRVYHVQCNPEHQEIEQ